MMRSLTLSRRQLLSAVPALMAADALSNSVVAAQDGARSSSSTSTVRAAKPIAILPETVLVTGGTGFIGGWCVVELLRRGYTVRATIRNVSKETAARATIARAVDADDRLSFVAADLTLDAGWDAALAGCDYVLHVASPLGGSESSDPQSLLAPARDGTLRVLRAAVAAGVKRVVMTSAATVATPPMSTPDRISDESVWFDPNESVDAYRHSKRLAERAAWDFMKNSGGATALTTVLPGAVFGPILSADSASSTDIIRRLLQGRVPANPRFGLQIVDVRDLVDLHIRAMTHPLAAGERFMAVGEFMWMSDISRTLREQLGSAASKVPTRTMPDWIFRTLAVFDSSLRAMTPRLGKMHRHTAAKAERVLQWHSRPVATTLVDCAESLIAANAI